MGLANAPPPPEDLWLRSKLFDFLILVVCELNGLYLPCWGTIIVYAYILAPALWRLESNLFVTDSIVTLVTAQMCTECLKRTPSSPTPVYFRQHRQTSLWHRQSIILSQNIVGCMALRDRTLRFVIMQYALTSCILHSRYRECIAGDGTQRPHPGKPVGSADLRKLPGDAFSGTVPTTCE